MKLQELYVENFIAYREPQTIPFGDLLGERLLLISGPTGSGKSTLMDAILYALFGADRRRAVRPPISQYNPTEPARVRLVFKLGEKTIRVKRTWIPYQNHWKETERIWEQWKGDEWVSLNPQQDLAPRFPLLEDYDTFRRVVAIPQGEYAHFINATSTDRYKLLQRIIPMGWVDQIREALKEMRQEIYAERDQNRLRLMSFLKGIPGIPEEALETTQDPLDFQGMLREAKNHHRHLREELQRKKKEAQAKEEALTQQQKDLQQLCEEEEGVEDLIKALQEIQNLQHRKEEIQALRREVERLEEYAEVFQPYAIQWQTLTKQLDEVRQRREEAQKKLQQIQKDREALKPDVENLEIYREELKKGEAEKERLSRRLKILEDLFQQVEKRDALEQRVEKAERFLEDFRWVQRLVLEKEHTQAQQHLDKVEKMLREIEAQREEIEMSFHKAHLAVLAQTLKEGDPCPLCGSPHHPHPFRPDEAIQPEELLKERRRLGEKINECRKKRDKLFQEIHRIQARLEGLPSTGRDYAVIREEWELLSDPRDAVSLWEQQGWTEAVLQQRYEALFRELHQVEGGIREILRQAIIVSGDVEEAKDDYQKTRQNLDILEKRLEALQERIRRIEDLEKRFQKEQKEWETTVRNLTESLEKLENEREGIRKSLEEQYRKATYHRTWEDVKRSAREITGLREKRHILTEWDNTLQKARQRRDQVVQKISSRVDTSFRGLLEMARQEGPDLSRALRGIQTWKVHLTQRRQNMEKAIERERRILKEIQEEIGSLRTHFQQMDKMIEEAFKILENWEKRRQRMDFLDLLWGHLGKPEFRYWVAGIFIRQILTEASRYIEEFSEGRFSFSYAHTTQGREEIPILVQDRYTGKIREAHHLSGGEKFMVSLALALGMIHLLVQSRSSDAPGFLFLDEGFGTLDRDTLTHVASMLHRHAEDQDVDLLVISHRRELMDYFPTHLVIHPSPHGSRIHIERMV